MSYPGTALKPLTVYCLPFCLKVTVVFQIVMSVSPDPEPAPSW